MNSPAGFIDHTLLKPDATESQFAVLCEEAVEHDFASVCVPPLFVPFVANQLYGSSVKVCTVVGFPCGYNSLRQKVAETAELVAAGADEIDMVISLGNLLAGHSSLVEEEIAQVVLAAEQNPVKVIIECCYLCPDLIRNATQLVVSAGAAYVKTSTGFGPSGAKVEDVALMSEVANGRVGVKAAGGIRDLKVLQQMTAAGATRIGTSSGVAIMQEWQKQTYGAR
ncbi:deoxyribose-phosphate aldolase [Malonomonas rubra DSM 5091]|uniref:Deoxyribose-phosphate aldolase n=1 Tax=Malonomonas rubra DSM 5091 TaxID=1122189 RepID=A0A1M6BY04_MALRU|nr:deoxyribose-phosphate aldolase [Malonomonas rubra]SHI53590.1 deoxyribose-phosphate aldolase [Malonomonas rubra DSM 5091]